jgi:hypothetical protein
MAGTARFTGLRDTAIFRLTADGFGWRSTANLNKGEKGPAAESDRTGGRWYPTLLTLADGNVLALAGAPGADEKEQDNFIPEVFTPAPANHHGAWHRLGSYADAYQRNKFFYNRTPTYPRAFLDPSGAIVFATHTFDGATVAMRVDESAWSAEFAVLGIFTPRDGWETNGGQYTGVGYQESAVMLPLLFDDGYESRFLLTGGNAAWMLDLSKWKWGDPAPVGPIWLKTQRKMTGNPRRINGHAVLLPTGEVLCVGGVSDDKKPVRPGVQFPEIFDPFADQPLKNGWRAETANRERAQVVRDYHSVALLMRDGRVWTAGSDINGAAGVDNIEKRIEIYEPWYYGNTSRPEILAAPDRWATGETFEVRTTQAGQIKRVAMVRTGSCTHAFNSDQRYISLEFHHIGGDKLLVTAPPDGNVAPTGMYFLYTINGENLPSAGISTYQSTTPESEAEREWDALYHP